MLWIKCYVMKSVDYIKVDIKYMVKQKENLLKCNCGCL